jgi:hypothetical protein
LLSGALSYRQIGSRSGLLFLFAVMAAGTAQAEVKDGEEFRAYIEAELSDLSRFHLPSDPSQVGPHGPVPPEDEPSKLFRALGWAVYGTSAADVVTTEIGLARGRHELNPVMRNRAVRIGAHVVVPIAVNKTTEFIRSEGYPTYALIIRMAVVGMWGFTSARNIWRLP